MSGIAGQGESESCINPEIVMGSVALEIWTSVNGCTGEAEEAGNGKGTYDR